VIRAAVVGGEDGFRVAPALAVVIAGAGLPPPGAPLHSRAADANPKARFTYSAPDPSLVDVIAQELAAVEPDRVSVVLAPSLDADEVLAGLPPEASGGPVSVQIVLTPARWPPGLARKAIARYVKLVPPGSTLCLSLVTGDQRPEGAQMMDAPSLAGGRGYCHTARDVTGWIEDAGLVLHPDGVQDVRALMRGWAVRYPAPPGVPGQVIGAVAVKPRGG
jgi:hypothetical protein